MKLFYARGACSLSPHIVLREAGYDFELESVHLGSKQTQSGRDFRTINPKGYVPALELDDGQILTEGPAIVSWLADNKPESKLAPPFGSFERYRLIEWLNFISTELHKQYSPLFGSAAPEEWKHQLREKISGRLEWVSGLLEKQDFLLGQQFMVVDAYLFTVLRWSSATGIDLGKWPAVGRYVERIAGRPAVKAALEAERLK